MNPISRRVRGFSLVEMMIALVAGLVVIGAVLAFTFSMAQSTGKNVAATRLLQELRTASNLITREVRRAGYDRNNYTAIGAGVFNLPYGDLTIGTDVSARDCLIMAYDVFGVNDGATSPGATEYKGFRRKLSSGTGKVQVNLADNPPVCNSSSTNWIDLTNTNIVDVTALQFFYPAYDTANDAPYECLDASAGTATSPPSDYQVVAGVNTSNGSNINVTVRDVCVVLTGQLAGDSSTVREVVEQVRVRADKVSNP